MDKNVLYWHDMLKALRAKLALCRLADLRCICPASHRHGDGRASLVECGCNLSRSLCGQRVLTTFPDTFVASGIGGWVWIWYPMTVAFPLALIKMIGLDLFLRILMTFPCMGSWFGNGVLALFTDWWRGGPVLKLMMIFFHSYDSIAQAWNWAIMKAELWLAYA
jgi:hypothetical protein